MGELIELAESLRAVLEELAQERRRDGGWRLPTEGENKAWCRLYRAEDSIREFEREMAKEEG